MGNKRNSSERTARRGREKGSSLVDKLLVIVVVIFCLEIASVAFSKKSRATAFIATTADGNSVSFPADYGHKVVLLDFWATWCGPCMEEAPNVANIYHRFHSQGFEVLGVSLDDAGTANNVLGVAASKGMDWPMVCDRRGWSSPLARMYGVRSIPQGFLIDGNSGKILAEGDDVRGDGLADALRAALAARR